MTLVKWMPKHNIYNIFDEVENMFDLDFINYGKGSFFTPSADVIENDKRYRLMIDLPGVDKRDIEISFCGSILIVSGERKNLDGHKMINEVYYGNYKRSFEFSSSIIENEIKAVYKNGILDIMIPKGKIQKPISSTIEIN